MLAEVDILYLKPPLLLEEFSVPQALEQWSEGYLVK